jgi:hypothetical protein
MNNIPHPAPSVNSPYDPDLNRFGLNRHSLIGFRDGSGPIQLVSVEDIVRNPDRYECNGEWKTLKSGCPFHRHGYNSKNGSLQFTVDTESGRFTYICRDPNHEHPGAKDRRDSFGNPYWVYHVHCCDSAPVSQGDFFAYVEVKAWDREAQVTLSNWMNQSGVQQASVYVDAKRTVNRVYFRKTQDDQYVDGYLNSDEKSGVRFVASANKVRVPDGVGWRKSAGCPEYTSASVLSSSLWNKSVVPCVDTATPKGTKPKKPKKESSVEGFRHNYTDRMESIGEREARSSFKKGDDHSQLLAGIEGFEPSPEDSRPEIEQLARAIHEAKDRVWNVRCKRAPTLLTTWNKGGVGSSSHTKLTCWQASCEDCRPFVLGSLASAVEVHLLSLFRAGAVISMYRAPLEVHTSGYTKLSLNRWSNDPKIDDNEGCVSSHMITRVSSYTETRVIIKNDWIGLKAHGEVLYFFCRNPDAGGNKNLAPTVITKNGVPHLGGTVRNEADILATVSVIMDSMQAATAEELNGDLLFGPRPTVSRINKLRQSITGRGCGGASRAPSNSQKKERREEEGVEEFQSIPVYGIKGFLEELSDTVETTITMEDPTGGGLFTKNNKGGVHMPGVNTTAVANSAVDKGRLKKGTPGHKRGGNKKHQEEAAGLQEAINSGLDGGHSFKYFTLGGAN